MRAYWWIPPTDSGASVNFGDDLTRFILESEGYSHEWSAPDGAELVLTGSVLEHLPAHWAGTVCGAGKLHERTRVHLADARVFALRGRLTLAGATGVRKDVALGDPGLLVPRWVRQPQAKHNLGVLPHWTDGELYQRFPYGRLIDPRQPAQDVVQQIAECKALITSSLHGAIVADAFGIPRQAELAPAMTGDHSHDGGDFKWRDYTSVYGEGPEFGHMHRVDREKVEGVQRGLLGALGVACGIDLPRVGQRRDPALSVLVPFRDDGEHRGRVWRWLRAYWRAVLPDAEIIQGHDDGTPFSKANAVNMAARLARGRTFAMVDADTHLPAEALLEAAEDVEHKHRHGRRTWYVPYNRLYRLNHPTTLEVLTGDPTNLLVPSPPLPSQLEELPGGPYDGHQYGAMAQVFLREAFWEVGGMDPRFRGWGCLDEKSEILTQTGWRHYSDLSVGDQVLTLNHKTGLSEWNPVLKMTVHPVGETKKMLRIKSKTHSSFSTMDHRWPALLRNGERIWRTTETLKSHDRIPTSAPCADLPKFPSHDDALVELVAWFVTEGHVTRLKNGSSGRVTIVQSHVVHSEHCAQIESSLLRCFGTPYAGSFSRARDPHEGELWRRRDGARDAYFHLNREAAARLLAHAPDKVPSFEFLLSLTQHQLNLFIEVAMRGDGHAAPPQGSRGAVKRFEQRDSRVVEAFVFAVLLSGKGVSVRERAQKALGDHRGDVPREMDYAMTVATIKSRDRFSPFDGVHEVVDYDGVVWCPTTRNGSWLARREGTVYFTGNCEDISLLRALDSLWGHHEVGHHQVTHLWHARIGSRLNDRQWVGQTWGAANSRLAQRYAGAIAEPHYMRGLADEHPLAEPLYR